MTPKVCSVAESLFRQRGHSLASHRVCFILVEAFRTTVKERAVKLVCSVSFRTPPVDLKFIYPLLAAINLMADCVSFLSSFISEPLDSHLPERLCLLRAELLFLSTTRVPSRRHVLNQRPQVQSVDIVPYYRSTRLFASYLGLVLLMVAVKYDGRTTDYIVFDG